MNILFDIGHPAHLHFFRNLIVRLQSEGHRVRVTGRHKDILVELAVKYGIKIEVFGVARKGMFNLGCELILRQWRLRKIVKEFRPDLMMAIAGTFISIVGKLTNVPVYVFYDTEHATISNMLAYPFATCIYLPQCYRGQVRWRHIRYNGYHELAYLHPRYFSPDPEVLKEVGLKKGEMFTIVRFVAWGAAHDIGRKGFTHTNKLKTVEELGRHGRVLISCEGKLAIELEPYRLRINIARIHHLMAYASLIFGESATMCSEGAVLGVPGVYVDPIGRGYTDEQEREYGLVFNFSSDRQDNAIHKGVEVLTNYCHKEWQKKAKRLIGEKIDVNQLLYQIAIEKPFVK